MADSTANGLCSVTIAHVVCQAPRRARVRETSPRVSHGHLYLTWPRPFNIRDAISARGAAMKLRSAPIFVSASASPPGKAAVAKKSETVNPIAATMPTTTRS